MIIDCYTHILPTEFSKKLIDEEPRLATMVTGMQQVKMLYDLETRFRTMDQFGDYRQVLSLPNPPLEEITTPKSCTALSRNSAQVGCKYSPT